MSTKDFEELLALLKRHGVKALIVGAHAVAFHSKPRYTKDFDLFVEPSVENGTKVVAALEEFGFGELGLNPADLASPGRILQIGVPPNRIDFMTSIDGISFNEAWSGRIAGRYGREEFPFIGYDELVRNKTASARPQDLADLAWLREKRSR